ncbi:MAG: ABC transporter substrate-binding protein, partial [Bacteroidota bacterium]|nr:ABC transporter substrate-binding protein [Bacteroidota bacterium]
MNTGFRAAGTLIFVACLFSGCRDGAGRPAGGADGAHGGDGEVGKMENIRYAKGFTIERFSHYKLLSIFNRSATGLDTLRYLLVERGYPAPPGFAGAGVIRVPVQSMVALFSIHVAEAHFAGIADRITGLGSFAYIYSPAVRRRIAEGKVRQVGLDGNLNIELILTMRPDVLIGTANPGGPAGKYAALIRAGIPAVINNDWLEQTPLGRAEWVKVMAALADREKEVDQKFDSVSAAYSELARVGRAATQKPHVIIGLPFKGSWFMPAGESYVACLLHDAGASYKWSDTRGTGSLALDFESVAPEALTAAYWLDIGDAVSKADIAARDSRYTQFLAYKNGNLFNNNRQTDENGANDYWESGGVSP